MEQFGEFAANHYILFSALIVIIALLIKSFVGTRMSGYQEVGPVEAVALINREEALVLDVRSENEFHQGHIVNARNLPLSVLSGRLGELEKHKGLPIVVSCKSGHTSAQACARLRKEGFEKLYSLKGGIMAWQSDNLPLAKKRK